MRCDGETEKPVEYRGPNTVEHFLNAIKNEEQKIKDVLAKPKKMKMTGEDWKNYRKTTKCHVCEKPFNGDSVKDHCHITGNYRGRAHNACNLKLRLSPKFTPIPVVFHNLRGYDSHLIMQKISKVEGYITCILNNIEKLIPSQPRSCVNSGWTKGGRLTLRKARFPGEVMGPRGVLLL